MAPSFASTSTSMSQASERCWAKAAPPDHRPTSRDSRVEQRPARTRRSTTSESLFSLSRPSPPSARLRNSSSADSVTSGLVVWRRTWSRADGKSEEERRYFLASSSS